MAVTLVDISSEILHNLLTYVNVIDLGRLARSCQFLREFIGRDELLWRKLYLKCFDEPDECPKSWSESLKSLIRMQKILESSDHDLKRDSTRLVLETTQSLLLSTKTSHPDLNRDFLLQHFHHSSRRSNVSIFLRQSSLFRQCGMPFDEPSDEFDLRQLSAKLHVFFGLEAEIRGSEILEVEGAREIHPYARSRVYDLRRYKPQNHWGPFMDDGSGRVDWEKVQAVFIVLAHGLRMLCERRSGVIGPFWDAPFAGLTKNSYRSVISAGPDDEDAKAQGGDQTSSRRSSGSSTSSTSSFATNTTRLPLTPPPSLPSTESFMGILGGTSSQTPERVATFAAEQAKFAREDPYGVEGTWMRIVNFLDYHDLFAFNFTGAAPPEDVERDPVTTTEAFRLILIKLWVTRIEYPEPEDEDNEGTNLDSNTMKGVREVERNGGLASKKMPIVHFAGKSRSLHIRWDPNANSQIRGYVRMTPHGDVRWTTFSVFHGEERWRSECVQIGGIKSQRGALGNWFDKDYDRHGPAGPTGFWKLGDSLSSGRTGVDVEGGARPDFD